MTTIRIELPDATARAADSLPSIADRMAAAGIEPMSMEEINARLARSGLNVEDRVTRCSTLLRRWAPRVSHLCTLANRLPLPCKLLSLHVELAAR